MQRMNGSVGEYRWTDARGSRKTLAGTGQTK